MVHRSPWPALLAAAGLSLSPLAARAHGIESSLQRLGSLTAGMDFSRPAAGGAAASGRLELQSRFSSGVPATEAAVRVVPPDGGQPIEVGRTDAEGRLTFSLPAQARADWEVQVDAGPGHRDYLELPGAGNGGDSAPLPPLRELSKTPGGGWVPLTLIGLLGLGGAGGWLRRRRRP